MKRTKLEVMGIIGGMLLVLVLGCAGKEVKPTQDQTAKEKEKAKSEESKISTPEEVAKVEEVTGKGAMGEGITIKKLENIHFDFDMYTIRPEDREVLGRNADWLKEHAKVRIQIEGHCDERGSSEYNIALGDRRANSAKSYLVSLGIDASRLSTVSYGEERPEDTGHNEEAWSKNRRAVFVIVSD